MHRSAYIAEFFGTCALIAFGAGSIINTQAMGGGNAGLLIVALAHGIIIAVAVSALGAISGGHFNPAVTFGLMLGKLISPAQAVRYIGAQLAGAVTGALALAYVFFPHTWQTAQLGTPMLASDVSGFQGILVEAFLTLFLVFAVYGTAIDHRAPKMGGLFIGLMITVDILLGGSLTGAAMNPARTFGPAFVGWIAGASYNPWAGHLVYWIGPLLGAVAAQKIYTKFLSERS